MTRHDRTYHPGVAVLTASVKRQYWLRQQLDAAGIRHGIVLLQDQQRGRMLPPFPGPLLLDTAGFERSLLTAILAELHVHRTPLPTVALVAPDDLAVQRLTLLCSAVYAMAAETTPVADLRLWLRYVGGSGRSASRGPVGLFGRCSATPADSGWRPAAYPGGAAAPRPSTRWQRRVLCRTGRSSASSPPCGWH